MVYSPGHETQNDSLYINIGAVDRTFFTPSKMVQAGHGDQHGDGMCIADCHLASMQLLT